MPQIETSNEELIHWLINSELYSKYRERWSDIPSSFAGAWGDDFWSPIVRKFAETEFWVENLDFMKAVEEKAGSFSRDDGPQEMKIDDGREIYDRFVKPGAQQEVNLPGGMRGALVEIYTTPQDEWAHSEEDAANGKMKPPAPDHFAKAYKEAYGLACSSYGRFVKAADGVKKWEHDKIVADLDH
jgi:hypothetical protein